MPIKIVSTSNTYKYPLRFDHTSLVMSTTASDILLPLSPIFHSLFVFLLQVLVLFHLRVRDLRPVFEGMTNLQFLLFQKVHISRIPPSIRNLESLLQLHLPHTLICLPDALINLKKLRKMSCRAHLLPTRATFHLTASGRNAMGEPKLRIFTGNAKINVPWAR